MLPRNIYLAFHIDTNRINARGSLDDMNLLEKWAANDVIAIDMSMVAYNEARQGNNRRRTEKAMEHIYTHTHATTAEERMKLVAIQKIVFPDGISDASQANDVEIIFNADKYGCILITNDGGSKSQPGGILGSANRLKRELGIRVMSSNEAVAFVKEKIRERDEHCRRFAREVNDELPAWVGKD
jgi:hypothetical protein